MVSSQTLDGFLFEAPAHIRDMLQNVHRSGRCECCGELHSDEEYDSDDEITSSDYWVAKAYEAGRMARRHRWNRYFLPSVAIFLIVAALFFVYMVIFPLVRWAWWQWADWMVSPYISLLFDPPAYLITNGLIGYLLLNRTVEDSALRVDIAMVIADFRLVVAATPWLWVQQGIATVGHYIGVSAGTMGSVGHVLLLLGLGLDARQIFPWALGIYAVSLLWDWGCAWLFYSVLFPLPLILKFSKIVLLCTLGTLPSFVTQLFGLAIYTTPYTVYDSTTLVEVGGERAPLGWSVAQTFNDMILPSTCTIFDNFPDESDGEMDMHVQLGLWISEMVTAPFENTWELFGFGEPTEVESFTCVAAAQETLFTELFRAALCASPATPVTVSPTYVAISELWHFVVSWNGLLRCTAWAGFVHICVKLGRRHRALQACSTIHHSMDVGRSALRTGSQANTALIWSKVCCPIRFARSLDFHAKLHPNPLMFLCSPSPDEQVEENEEVWSLRPITRELSLHSRLDSRSPSIGHENGKLHRLKTELSKLHGEAGLLQVLLERAKVRAKRSEGRSVFLQSVGNIIAVPASALKNGLDVMFEEELGSDAGGLTAEWFSIIAEELSGALLCLPTDLAEARKYEKQLDNLVIRFTGLGTDETPGGAACSSVDDATWTPLSKSTTWPSSYPSSFKLSSCSLGMFRALPDGTLMLQPSPFLGPMWYLALGKVLGLALLLNKTIPLQLSSAMLKILADETISRSDVESIDPIYFRNRMLAVLEPGGIAMMCEMLDLDHVDDDDKDDEEKDEKVAHNSTDTSDRRKRKRRTEKKKKKKKNDKPFLPFQYIANDGKLGAELCEGGAQRAVDDNNCTEYIQLLSEHYLCGDIREHLQVMLAGFHEIVPAEVLLTCEIDYVDLGLLLSGVPDIDVHDWEANTLHPAHSAWLHNANGTTTLAQESIIYGDSFSSLSNGFGAPMISSSKMMGWFWQCVREMDNEQQARLLRFSTGSSRSPPGGFKQMMPRLFNVMIDMHPQHLLSAATCFNTLRLPACASKSALKAKILQVCANKDLATVFGDT